MFGIKPDPAGLACTRRKECLFAKCHLFFQPSFGYIITSPEKREPFALISPSELRSAGGSPHSDDEDRTLNPGLFGQKPVKMPPDIQFKRLSV